MFEKVFVITLLAVVAIFGICYAYSALLPLEISVRVRADAGNSVMIVHDCPVVYCEYDAGLDIGTSSDYDGGSDGR